LKTIRKLIIFFALFFAISQLFFYFLFPRSYIYNNRLNYDVFKDNVYSIDATVKAIKSTIKKDKLKNYIIMVGDSVGYGTPCPPENTMSAYMNEIAKKENSDIRVFNIGVPSTMFGDFYTIIKLLNSYDISTHNLIINFSYWEINAKTPTYWFRHYLKELDNESYTKMVELGHIKELSTLQNIKSEIYHFANKNVDIIGYSSFITNKIKCDTNAILGQPTTELKVWSEKSQRLTKTLNLPENRWYYSDKTFNLSESSPQIYFLNKITELQKGKNTLFFLNAMNDEILAGATEKEGFKNNLAAIGKCFSDRGLNFIDYNKKVDYKYFSDFVHLLPDGYKFMAQDLWHRIQKEI
jgi:hypothetical protein